ncbi:cytochrome P450 [Daldinia bambusicola]|nr:cytochrome P450 [Daldinia bambusicola]
MLIYVTYQIFLHPLSRPPGPPIAELTDGYNGFYAFQGRLHLKTRQNQLTYGAVVRQGPNKLVFNSIKALQDIYRNDCTTKPKAYIALGPGLNIQTTITATDQHIHRPRRQLVGQVLSEHFMRIFEPTMIGQVNLFVQQILPSALNLAPVNITEYDLGLQTSEENRFMVNTIHAVSLWSSIFLHWLNSRRFRLGLVSLQVFRQLRGKYLSVVEKMIASRQRQDKDAQRDLYSVLADALDSENGGLRQSELWAEANLFLVAAGDTAKTALSAVFFYLSPLRMPPPAAGLLWREPLRTAGDLPSTVDGHVIPRGTLVDVNIYSVHHNVEYFLDPFTYQPERWLDNTMTTEKKIIMRDAFVPFSLGPQGCAGQAMAYSEISLAVAKTLWYFDFKRATGRLGEIGAGVQGAGEGREQPGEFQIFDNFTVSTC